MPENAYKLNRRGPGRMTDEQFQAWRNAPRSPPTHALPEPPGPTANFRAATRNLVSDYKSGLLPESVGSRVGRSVGKGVDYMADVLSPVGRLAGKVANLPGARVAGRTMGRLALPVAAAQGAYDLSNLGYEGYLANKAANEAAREQSYSSSRYGTPERATTSRRSSKGIMSDWSEPSNYVLTKSSSNDFGW